MSESQKKRKIIEILRKEQGPFMVFVNIRANCDVVNRELNRSGFRAVAIHGGKMQDSRQRALEDFRNGKFPILVATDVAGRGIDVPNVKHVINYDMSSTIEKYTHRIGRTGRAGNKGIATAFFVPGQENKHGENGGLWEPLHTLLKEAKQEIPPWFSKLGNANSGGTYRPGKRMNYMFTR